MAQKIRTQLAEIADLVRSSPNGISKYQISDNLKISLHSRTILRRLASLIEDKTVVRRQDQGITKYFPLANADDLVQPPLNPENDHECIFSDKSQQILKFLVVPATERSNVTYSRSFLEDYVPNETHYIGLETRKHLLRNGIRFDDDLAAGTFAKQISQRLLIELSYNSSRLEGNSYSKLDTKRLIQEGLGADGKANKDTIMILNHKEAISLLIENAQDIDINSFSVKSIHGLLSNDLISNSDAVGDLRKISVGIGMSSYKPIDNPLVLEKQFELMLSKARLIRNPFEQCLFILIHLAYLQPFEDVNKRTSRIVCNLPLVKRNLCPLSFTDISADDYTKALLAVYEKNEIQPMLDVFVWAYIQSCNQYEVEKQSVVTVDADRIRYRYERRELICKIILAMQPLQEDAIKETTEEFCRERQISDYSKFAKHTLDDLQSIKNGATIGIRVTEKQLQDWREI